MYMMKKSINRIDTMNNNTPIFISVHDISEFVLNMLIISIIVPYTFSASVHALFDTNIIEVKKNACEIAMDMRFLEIIT